MQRIVGLLASSLCLALATPEVFDRSFAGFSAGPAATNKQRRLLWMGVGSQDFLYKPTVAFDALMKERKIENKSLVTGGGHTWMNARHYLTETLRLFFR